MNQWRKWVRSGECGPEVSLLLDIDPNRAVSQVQLQESRGCFTSGEIEHARFK